MQGVGPCVRSVDAAKGGIIVGECAGTVFGGETDPIAVATCGPQRLGRVPNENMACRVNRELGGRSRVTGV